MNQRKVYPPELKREAVGLTQLPNMVVEEVARKLGVSSSALHKWIRAEKTNGALAFAGQRKQVERERAMFAFVEAKVNYEAVCQRVPTQNPAR